MFFNHLLLITNFQRTEIFQGFNQGSEILTLSVSDDNALSIFVESKVCLSTSSQDILGIYSSKLTRKASKSEGAMDEIPWHLYLGAVHKLRLQFSEIFDHPPT